MPHIDLGAYREWSTYDLLDPAERGRIAEYVVGETLGCLGEGRQPNRPYALETAEGCRIDVRSASRVQSWGARAEGKPSPVVFNIAGASKRWDHTTGRYAEGARARWSHVHVCALLDHTDRATANPAQLDQWRFWVLPTAVLDGALGLHRAAISAARLARLGAHEGTWRELPDMVRATWSPAESASVQSAD